MAPYTQYLLGVYRLPPLLSRSCFLLLADNVLERLHSIDPWDAVSQTLGCVTGLIQAGGVLAVAEETSLTEQCELLKFMTLRLKIGLAPSCPRSQVPRG